jgi:hypothetical protein
MPTRHGARQWWINLKYGLSNRVRHRNCQDQRAVADFSMDDQAAGNVTTLPGASRSRR